MKRLRKVIIGVLCLLLLFALSHATDIDQHKVKQEGEVKFAWEGTTGLTPDQKKERCVIKYHLYVTDKKDPPPSIYVTDKEDPSPSNEALQPVKITEENEASNEFPDLGKFYIGVATAIYCPSKEKEISDIKESDIAWSHNKSYTNGDPFLVIVVEDKDEDEDGEPKKIE